MADVIERVEKIVVERLEVDADKVVEAATFQEDLGADSLDLVELVMAFEEEFAIEIPDEVDVLAIRKQLDLTRAKFSEKLGFSPRTVQHWEQGDRRPQGAARVLLVMLQRDAKAVEKILYPIP